MFGDGIKLIIKVSAFSAVHEGRRQRTDRPTANAVHTADDALLRDLLARVRIAENRVRRGRGLLARGRHEAEAAELADVPREGRGFPAAGPAGEDEGRAVPHADGGVPDEAIRELGLEPEAADVRRSRVAEVAPHADDEVVLRLRFRGFDLPRRADGATGKDNAFFSSLINLMPSSRHDSNQSNLARAINQ